MLSIIHFALPRTDTRLTFRITELEAQISDHRRLAHAMEVKNHYDI